MMRLYHAKKIISVDIFEVLLKFFL